MGFLPSPETSWTDVHYCKIVVITEASLSCPLQGEWFSLLSLDIASELLARPNHASAKRSLLGIHAFHRRGKRCSIRGYDIAGLYHHENTAPRLH